MMDTRLLQALHIDRFVAIDLETTGLDYEKEEIIEVAAVRYEGGKAQKDLHYLLNPGRPIPQNIAQLTGITDAMVTKADHFSDHSHEILEFMGNDPLVAHNINFDLSFLQQNLEKFGKLPEGDHRTGGEFFAGNGKYDTLVLAKTFLPFQHGFSLTKLAEFFEIKPENTHRALPDAHTAALIFLKLVEISLASDFRDIRKINEILGPTSDPIKSYFMNLQLLMASGKFHIEPSFDKEQFLVSTNLYNIIGEDDTPGSGRLKTEEIDEEEISGFFSSEGVLSSSFGNFEHRDVQVSMAGAVAHAFNKSEFLVVEAGTGTGKSMAYLLPAIRWSMKNYGPFGRVVISTNTKNLQEQLFYKDLPILHSILNEKFKAVLLKGKSNYLCLDKWYTILKDMKFRLNTYERSKILSLFLWVKRTQTGDISENNGFAAERNMNIWSKFIAEDNYCPGKSCKYYNQCFLWRARNHARDAHLVLVNHSLLFSDLATQNSVLNEYANVILDEAHNIEKVATEYLGIQLTVWDFRDTFQKLYSKDGYETGILIQLRKRIQLSELEKSKKELIFGHLDTLLPQIKTHGMVTQGFFKELTIFLRSLVPELARSEYSSRYRYRSADGLYQKMESYIYELKEYLKKLHIGILDLLEVLREVPADSFNYQKQLVQELLAQSTKLEGLIANLDFLMVAEWDNWVYWFELPNRTESDDSRLYAAPLKIAEILHEKLYKNLKTAIFTSATLAVGKKFEYIEERTGLNLLEPGRLQTLMLDSPFNYKRQVLVAIPSYFPDPRSPDYRTTIKQFLEQLVREQPRGTLVLFTSYSLLNDVFDSLRMRFESEKISLLAQGISGSRHAIINEFKQHPNSFLLGTDSFWEGIDVPGKALEMLLLTKLPFDVPTEPIVQAKAELIQKQGGNAFLDYTIPEAVIKFRQGFGRLIRSKLDYGAVIILDNRVIKKMYGQIFLESLPAKPMIFQQENDLWEELLNWFQKTGKIA
jgi:predicted DnaQ family exonuclease/DinG family helicase